MRGQTPPPRRHGVGAGLIPCRRRPRRGLGCRWHRDAAARAAPARPPGFKRAAPPPPPPPPHWPGFDGSNSTYSKPGPVLLYDDGQVGGCGCGVGLAGAWVGGCVCGRVRRAGARGAAFLRALRWLAPLPPVHPPHHPHSAHTSTRLTGAQGMVITAVFVASKAVKGATSVTSVTYTYGDDVAVFSLNKKGKIVGEQAGGGLLCRGGAGCVRVGARSWVRERVCVGEWGGRLCVGGVGGGRRRGGGERGARTPLPTHQPGKPIAPPPPPPPRPPPPHPPKSSLLARLCPRGPPSSCARWRACPPSLLSTAGGWVGGWVGREAKKGQGRWQLMGRAGQGESGGTLRACEGGAPTAARSCPVPPSHPPTHTPMWSHPPAPPTRAGLWAAS